MSLDRRHHPGDHILTIEQRPRFGLETRPRTAREFAQQLLIEAGGQSQTLWCRYSQLYRFSASTSMRFRITVGGLQPIVHNAKRTEWSNADIGQPEVDSDACSQ